MPDLSDHDLIRDFVRASADDAFEKLVHRHVDFVYSTALRVLRDSSLADDVTQRVFVALARHAPKLQDRPALIGWLHETARNFAVTTIRTEERRRRREQEAASLNAIHLDNSEAAWTQIAPFLDEALAQLNPDERDLILWRYFERKTAGQIGERLGLSGDAAQKRIVRAMERLRSLLADHGLTTSAAGLALVLGSQVVQSAPAGLAASAIAAAGMAGVGTSTTSIVELFMASIKAKFGLAAALAVAVSTPLILQHQTNSRLIGELTNLRQQSLELDRVRGEVDRFAAEARSSSEQRAREAAELARLRGELASLKARQSKLAGPGKGASPAVPQEKKDASAQAGDELVRREAWRNVGFQSPAATVQTVEWAKVNGETNVIANAFAWADELSRAGIEAIFAAAPESVRTRYGSADEYVLSLFNHSGPQDDRHTLTSYRIVTEDVKGDEALIHMEYNYADGFSSTFPRRYVRIGSDWRQALDFDAPSQTKLSAGLQAEGSGADDTPPEK